MKKKFLYVTLILLFFASIPQLSAEENSETEPVASPHPSYITSLSLAAIDDFSLLSIELTRAILPKLSLGLMLGGFQFNDSETPSICPCASLPIDDKYTVRSYFVGIPILFMPLGVFRSGPYVSGAILVGDLNSTVESYRWNFPKENQGQSEDPTLKCTRKYKRSGSQVSLMGGGGMQWFPTANLSVNGGLFLLHSYAVSSRRYDEESTCPDSEGESFRDSVVGSALGISAGTGYSF
jgi:hypothetical protein